MQKKLYINTLSFRTTIFGPLLQTFDDIITSKFSPPSPDIRKNNFFKDKNLCLYSTRCVSAIDTNYGSVETNCSKCQKKCQIRNSKPLKMETGKHGFVTLLHWCKNVYMKIWSQVSIIIPKGNETCIQFDLRCGFKRIKQIVLVALSIIRKTKRETFMKFI